jgi:hypothetical protein
MRANWRFSDFADKLVRAGAGELDRLPPLQSHFAAPNWKELLCYSHGVWRKPMTTVNGLKFQREKCRTSTSNIREK